MTGDAPLAGMRVLDLSRLLPGPYCSQILADFGAEVVKVEELEGGDWMRSMPPLVESESVLFRAVNRGKKSITLNLKSEKGRSILLQLAQTADVLLESFRPGVMDRLELGYEVLAEANPRLVYCALTGYGTDGPHRGRPGHDLNYLGLAGFLDLNGPRDGPPAVPGAPIADLTGALWAAVGILLALVARGRTGRGQRVDGSLLGGAFSCLPIAVARLGGGQLMARGASDLTGGVVCYNIYETADGHHVTLSALEPKFWLGFCEAVGREDLVDQHFAPAIPGESAYEELCALFRSRTREDWVEAMAEADACCEPLLTLEEAVASAPVRALGMLAEPGIHPAVRLSSMGEHRSDPAPALGEHTAALLAEIGYDALAVEQLRGEGVVG